MISDIATVIEYAMKASEYYSDLAERAKTMTLEEAQEAWAESGVKIQAMLDEFETAKKAGGYT